MRGATGVAQAVRGAKFRAVSADPLRTSVEVRVRYAETDRMGVAYHAHYLQWAELGRTEHMRRHGVRYRDLEERGHLLAVAEAGLRIVRSARYDDVLRVTAWLTDVGSRKVVFAYRIERVDLGLAGGRPFDVIVHACGSGGTAAGEESWATVADPS